MNVEVLYVEGCPNVEPTIERLKKIFQAVRLNPTISLTRVEDAVMATTVGFLGSPTVRINGLDIEPSARQRTAFGMMCRTYEGGGVPSEYLIRSAIVESQKNE